jgi:hypothetical protein
MVNLHRAIIGSAKHIFIPQNANAYINPKSVAASPPLYKVIRRCIAFVMVALEKAAVRSDAPKVQDSDLLIRRQISRRRAVYL